jgi:hypothetical protein
MMPTIEIICLKSEKLPNLPPFENFAYIEENKLQSHRGIFQAEFDQVTGIILHLGNKNLEGKEDGGWFAGDLIEWTNKEIIIPQIKEDAGSEQWWGEDQDSTFYFTPNAFKEVKSLLELLLNNSPAKQLYFTTDYQFGPSEGVKRSNYSFKRFIEEHDRYGLRWNCLYQIHGDLKKV